MRPGQALRFEAVSVADAHAVLRAKMIAMADLVDGIEPAGPIDGIDLAALYGENLIGGTVDASHPGNFPGHLDAEDET